MRAAKRTRKQLVIDLLQSSEDEEEPAVEISQAPCCHAQVEMQELKKDNDILKAKVSDLEVQITILRQELRSANGLAERKFVEDIKHTLKKVLSPQQIDLLLCVKKRVNWSEEDLSQAFGLR